MTRLRRAVGCAVGVLALWGHATSQSPTRDQLAQDPARFLQAARIDLGWDEAAPPASLVGPIWFVGTRGLGAFLITGSQGHVLLASGMPGSGPLIEASIRELGFDPQDVEILLTGHAHADHVGGHAWLAQATGARIAMMEEEVPLFESGGELDFQYGAVEAFRFEPARVDTVLHDGDVVRLGDIALRAHRTPGHTRGSTTYVMEIVVDGRPLRVVFPDGAGVNPGYRIEKDPSYPGIGDDYRATFAFLESLEPDVWLGYHNEVDDLWGKVYQTQNEGLEAWIDPAGYHRYLDAQRAVLEESVQGETGEGPAVATTVPVTVHEFVRAETDRYLAETAAQGGLGRLMHRRGFATVDEQTVARMDRDTLSSSGVFDLDAGPVTLVLPDPGGRYAALQVLDQDHYTVTVRHAPGRITLARHAVGTRYAFATLRVLADPNDADDLRAAHALQDAVRVQQAAAGALELPAWDPVSLTKAREALAALGALGEVGRAFGAKGAVDPFDHLIGAALGWGEYPPAEAVQRSFQPPRNDGETPYVLTVRDVPVDGFWSVTVYDARGFLVPNELERYSLGDRTALRDADGSTTIRFGGPADAPNHLPITPGWSYTVRLYRPRAEIADGSWTFPEARVAE